jgi:hypothetical protein
MKRKPPQKDELFVKLMLTTLDAPAWRALSHGARSVYIALKRRLRNDGNNNGKIFLSGRQAETELRSKREYIARWFQELEHYGFIVMTARLSRHRRQRQGTTLAPDRGRLRGRPAKSRFPALERHQIRRLEKKSRPLKGDHLGPQMGAIRLAPKTGPYELKTPRGQMGAISRCVYPSSRSGSGAPGVAAGTGARQVLDGEDRAANGEPHLSLYKRKFDEIGTKKFN